MTVENDVECLTVMVKETTYYYYTKTTTYLKGESNCTIDSWVICQDQPSEGMECTKGELQCIAGNFVRLMLLIHNLQLENTRVLLHCR